VTDDERIQDTMEVRKIPMRMAPLTRYIIKRVVKILMHGLSTPTEPLIKHAPPQDPKPHGRVAKEPRPPISADMLESTRVFTRRYAEFSP